MGEWRRNAGGDATCIDPRLPTHALRQAHVDHIFQHVAHEAAKQRVQLAKFAVAETKMGCVEDKVRGAGTPGPTVRGFRTENPAAPRPKRATPRPQVVKNCLAAELPLARYRHDKTVGGIERLPTQGLTRIAVPKGPIAAILPTTNPTSTAILKSLFALKTRNAVLFLPHPRAADCSAEAVRVCCDAAVSAGAPAHVLQPP